MSVAVDRSPGEVRAVAIDAAGRLLDIAIERPGGPGEVGDLHVGRVVARAPAMAGAFVALGRGPDGFLPDSAGGKEATEGAALTVRVTRAPQGGKGPRLAAEGTPLASEPTLLEHGPGAEGRLHTLHPGARSIPWNADIEDRVAELGGKLAALPGGAMLRIHPTPALVAIDIDMGGTLSKAAAGGGREAAHRALNAAAMAHVARQIRLRHLGGAIVVDLAGMPIRKRAALGPALAAALADDPLEPRFLGFSGLGLAEILRRRLHPPLHELLAGAHAAALEAARAWVLVPPLRVLRAGIAVIRAIEEDRTLMADLRNRLGEVPRMLADPALGLSWRLDPP